MFTVTSASTPFSHRFTLASSHMSEQLLLQPPPKFPQVGYFTTPGTRGRAHDYQHDRYICHSDEHATVLVVFDGHGRPHNGHLISQHCAEQFLHLLQQYPAWSEHNVKREQPDPAMTTALSGVVQTLENDSLKITDKVRQFSGTTLCAVILKDGFLYTANVGDSRAVLGMKSDRSDIPLEPLQLTIDHNCSNPLEKKRIEENGGFVARNRLNGDLDMSRTIGDHEFKSYRNQIRFNRSGKQFGDELLVATPDITTRKLDGQEVILIVATDGLWIQSLQNDLIITIAHSMLQKGKDAHKVARGLSQFAMGSGSTDNITVVIAILSAVEKSSERHSPFHEFRARRRLRKNGLNAVETAEQDGGPAVGGRGRRGSRVRSLFSRRQYGDERTVHSAHEFDDMVLPDRGDDRSTSSGSSSHEI